MDGDDDRPGGGPPFPQLIRIVFAVVVAGLAGYALQTGRPVVSLVGAVVTGVFMLTEEQRFFVTGLLRRGVARLFGWILGSRVRQGAAALATVLTVALVGATGGPWLWHLAFGEVSGPGSVTSGCPHPVELRILTSTDGLEPTRELARDYQRWAADRHDHCPTVFPFVYAASASATSTALARGWRADDTQDPLATVGPRPDVWLPESTLDVARVIDLAKAEKVWNLDQEGKKDWQVPLLVKGSVASSPMVLAVLGPLTGSVGDATDWSGLVSTYLSAAPSRVLAPDPEVSTIGLMASAGYLLEADGDRVDLVATDVARRREQTILASGSVAGDDSATMLCRYRRATEAPPTTAVAVLTSQQMWQRFVAGKPLGGGCADQVPTRAGGVVLTTPATPVLDHPFIGFTWTASAQQPSVDDFLGWLSDPANRKNLTAVGLDAARTNCSELPPVDPLNSPTPEARPPVPDPGSRNQCVPTGLAKALTLHRSVKIPGRVLLALDASGSMADRVGPNGISRFAIAAQGVTQALGQMGPQDQSGLWIFPNAAGRGPVELVKIDKGTSAHRDRIAAGLKAVRPIGATPLYNTVLTGMRAVAGQGDGEPIRALVVLTDGEDTSSGRTAQATQQKVRELAATNDVRLYLIATGDARCEGRGDAGRDVGLHQLTDAGRGRCFDAGTETVPGIMAELFGVLWSGR